MERSLVMRSNTLKDLAVNYTLSQPHITQADKIFEHSKYFRNPHLLENDEENEDDTVKASHTCNFSYFSF